MKKNDTIHCGKIRKKPLKTCYTKKKNIFRVIAANIVCMCFWSSCIYPYGKVGKENSRSTDTFHEFYDEF